MLIALRLLGLLDDLPNTSTFVIFDEPHQNPAGRGCDGRVTNREMEA